MAGGSRAGRICRLWEEGSQWIRNALTIAVPKGRLQKPVMELLERAGVDCGELGIPPETHHSCSRYRMEFLWQNRQMCLHMSSTELPIWESWAGCALESRKDVAELLDLGFVPLTIVAVLKSSGIRDIQDLDFNSRVATKFPRITTEFFSRQGIQAEVVHLNGSVELGPIVGLAVPLLI